MKRIYYFIIGMIVIGSLQPSYDSSSQVTTDISSNDKKLESVIMKMKWEQKKDTIAAILEESKTEEPKVIIKYRTKWRKAKPDTVEVPVYIVVPDSSFIPDLKSYSTENDYADPEFLKKPKVIHDTIILPAPVKRKNFLQRIFHPKK